MKREAVLALIILALAYPTFAQKKKVFPKLLEFAQYAYAETQYGPSDETVLDSRVTNEDREAVARVEKAIQTWGHYKLTAKPGEADVILVARPGRLVDGNVGVGARRGLPQPSETQQANDNTWLSFGAEVGPTQDFLAVFVNRPNWNRDAPLWYGMLDHGLDSPDMPLFRKFKDEVDAAGVKSPTSSSKTRP